MGRSARGRAVRPGVRWSRARALSVLVGSVSMVLPTGAAAADGPWVWPVAGPHEVSRAFAPPAFRYGAGHRGVDLPAAPGSVVRAAGAGRISYAGLLAGRGVVVVVHGELRTTYEPVDTTVSLGELVAAGAPLGRLLPGHLGCGAAACLHWGLRRGDDYLDPVALVDRPPVRLLPVGPPVASRSGPGLTPLPAGDDAVVAGPARASARRGSGGDGPPAEAASTPSRPDAAGAALLATGSVVLAAAAGAVRRRLAV